MPAEYVMDTSAAGKLFRNEKESDALRAWMKKELANGASFMVPPVFEFELRNLLVRTAKERGDDDEEEDEWDDYLRVRRLVRFVDDMDAEETMTTAVLKGLTASDASYQLLTIGGRRLVTYDKDLLKTAKDALSPGRASAA
ncbi:MAG: PIN domain-containing protein [Candidatus Thermoplasmatota archaeon]